MEHKSAVRFSTWLLVSFVLVPSACVLAWLIGYQTGGWNELMAGYMYGELTISVLISSIINFGCIFSKHFAWKIVALLWYCFMLYCWFGIAAGIASV